MTRRLDLTSLKVAIVHDWLVTYGGAERVLEQILKVIPNADLFSLCDFLPKGKRDFIQNKPVTTSLLQNMPGASKRYRDYLILMPYAIEQLDLSDYDLVISSSHAVAHGVLTTADQLHISYINNTMVYVWDMYQYYLKTAGLDRGLKGLVARPIMHYVRNWDAGTAHRVDKYIANSEHMSRRLTKLYGRDSEVIYPPVEIDQFSFDPDKADFYVVVSRLVPFKRIDLVVKAFAQMPHKRLVVVGDGPELKNLRKMAGRNTEFTGFLSTREVNEYVGKAKAFMFSSVEPFGIAVVEAQAAGTPVIAYAGGAAVEIVKQGQTGMFFYEQTPEAIVEAVNQFESSGNRFEPEAARENATRFSAQVFRERFLEFVNKEVESFFSARVALMESNGQQPASVTPVSEGDEPSDT